MIISGKFFYKNNIVEGCIVVEDGVIVDICKDVRSDDKFEVSKGLILPAGLDVHVHFRDFEESYKETIESGSLSALHGGICLVVDQPNTKPPVVDEKNYLKRIEKASKTSYVDYSLNLGLTEENSSKIEKIIEKIERNVGIPAIGEVFLQHKTMQVSYETLKSVRDRIKKLITVHAEDAELIRDESVRPKEAEIVAVRRCVEMGKFYFCHISTLEALEIIYRRSFAEVTPHHLLLSERKVKFERVNPPLRSERDRIELLRNIDKVDVIASDHAPHTVEDKKNGAPGFPGVETMYPLILNLVKKGIIELKTVVEKIVVNPAKIFGFDMYSGIEVGNYANLAVFDFSEVRKIRAEDLHSKAEWTPYEGFEAIFPKAVFVRGVRALDCGEVLVDRGFGTLATRSHMQYEH